MFHFQKHLWSIIGSKLTLDIYVKSVMTRVNKTIGPVRNFQDDVPRTFLVTICDAFIIPHLSYGKMIIDYVFNDSFWWKMELVQYEKRNFTEN